MFLSNQVMAPHLVMIYPSFLLSYPQLLRYILSSIHSTINCFLSIKMSSSDTVANEKDLTAMLDKMSDTKGLANLSDATEDWTDVKHSERKKRDRILADGVVLKLMQKSDYQGFKRLFENLAIMAVTAYAIHQLDVYPFTVDVHTDWHKMVVFVPLYLFYGFQFQGEKIIFIIISFLLFLQTLELDSSLQDPTPI